MSMKEKLLFISPRCPIPPFVKGDQKRSYVFIKSLETQYEVDLISFTDRILTREDHAFLRSLVHSYQIFRRSKIKALLTMLLGSITFQPFQYLYFYDLKAQKAINNLLKENNYNFVFCQLSRVAGYIIDKDISAHKIIDFQDCFSENMINRSRNETNLLKKFIFAYESFLVKRAEKDTLKKCSLAIFVSDRDASIHQGYKEKIRIIPVSINTNLFTYKERTPRKHPELLFFGNMGYFPNYDAAIWFIDYVFPLIEQKIPNIKLTIVGTNPPHKLSIRKQNNISITGFVNSFNPYLKRADLAILPIRAGSGMQNKILEALASGLPVVCSPQVIAGSPELSPFVKVSILEPNTFSNNVINCLKSYREMQKMTRAGNKYIAKHYSSKAVASRLLGILATYKKRNE